MAQVYKSVLVEHSAARMFALVDAVEHYPEFLPWCGGTQVHERNEELTWATIHIDYHSLRHRYTTRNRKQPPEWIHIELHEGPFRHLAGHWHFKPLGENACKVEFKLEFEFSSRLIERLIGPVFHYIANTLMEAFIRRADQLYPSDLS